MRKCPYCAEEIQEEAIQCRFCGSGLNNKKKQWKSCLVGCLVVMLIMLILATIFVHVTLYMCKAFINSLLQAGGQRGIDSFLQDFSRIMTDLVYQLRESWLHLVNPPSNCPNCV